MDGRPVAGERVLVKASGRFARVIADDGSDVPFKVQFEDSQVPAEDWLALKDLDRWEAPVPLRVTEAVDVVDTPKLCITEYFGSTASGDARLSACIAEVMEPHGQMQQVPEYDQYILVTAGEIKLACNDCNEEVIAVSAGHGATLRAGQSVTWSWAEPSQYVTVCLPGSSQPAEPSALPESGASAEAARLSRLLSEAAARRASPSPAQSAAEAVLDRMARSPAQSPEQEQELLQALLVKYADHRGVGQDAKWAVILREFNSRATEGSQKSEASLKRAARRSGAQEAQPESGEKAKDDDRGTWATEAIEEIARTAMALSSEIGRVNCQVANASRSMEQQTGVDRPASTEIQSELARARSEAREANSERARLEGELSAQRAEASASHARVAALEGELFSKTRRLESELAIQATEAAEARERAAAFEGELAGGQPRAAAEAAGGAAEEAQALRARAAALQQQLLEQERAQQAETEALRARVAFLEREHSSRMAAARQHEEQERQELTKTHAAQMELLRVKVASLEGALAQAKASPRREAKQQPQATDVQQFTRKASSNSTRDNVSDRASDRISDRDHESVKSTTEGAPTEGQTDLEIASLNGSASPTYCHNIPDYITPTSPSSRTPDMIRASSLSCFDRLIDTEGLAELRGKMDEIRQEECPEERPVRYGARHLNTPIVIVSSEMHPWSKTGGLAMVVSSYAYEFAMRGHRTMAIAPRYADYKDMEVVGSSKIWLDGQENEVRYYYTQKVYGSGKACDYIFVDHPCFHRSAGLYGDPKQGGEYQDNLFRFSLLSIAALEAPLLLNLGGSTYGQEVCFIANDWQTGLLPLYFHYKYKMNSTYRNARVIMTLHNMGYQGRYRMSKFPVDRFLGLPREAERELQCEDCHYGRDCMNLLGGGIRMADRVLTVSPTYAKEIQTSVGGLGLDHALREKCGQQRLEGILNGISDEWSPMTDPYIPMNYSKANFQEGKSVCKAALQRELGLRVDASACLVGFCGRLCFQKGIHMINDIIPWLMTDTGNDVNGRIQLILMGKGDMGFERQVGAAEAAFKGRVCGYVGFDPEVEHRMMAGCDLLLMPSQYEPCGLPQMYAQQYGTLPVVHETGGLKDSVKGMWDEIRDRNSATGFLFSGFDVNRLKERTYQAMSIFHHKKDLFRQMQQNAIASDYYWPQAIDQYEKHIDATMEAPSWRR